VIQSFGDLATEAVYHGREDRLIRRLPKQLWPAIRRKLDRLNAIVAIADWRVPAGSPERRSSGTVQHPRESAISRHFPIFGRKRL
jgi:hypothetical protein